MGENSKTLKWLPKIDPRDPVLNHRAPVLRSRVPVLRSRVPVLRSRAPVLRSRAPVLRLRPRNEKAIQNTKTLKGLRVAKNRPQGPRS